MRNGILITLLMWCCISYAQNILEYEKKIDIAQKYLSREINFMNSTDKTVLSGTLIQPKSDFKKIVIIVPGSGKDTRHSHYKLAEHLLKNNIAVYRFDDRGVGKSKGFYSNSIDLLSMDIVGAVQRIFYQFYENKKEIGVISHSLGGMATVIARDILNNEKIKVDFLVQIASPIQNFSTTTKHQIETLPHYQIKDKSIEGTKKILEELLSIVSQNKSETISQIQQKGYEYLKSNQIDLNDVKFWNYTHIQLYQYNLTNYYKTLDVPMLYLIGKKDKYVSANEEMTTLQKLENPLTKVTVFNELNHYLSTGNFQNKDIYEIDKKATETILQWIDSI